MGKEMKHYFKTKNGYYKVSPDDIFSQDVFLPMAEYMNHPYEIILDHPHFFWAHYDLVPFSNGVIVKNYYIRKGTAIYYPYDTQITNLN